MQSNGSVQPDQGSLKRMQKVKKQLTRNYRLRTSNLKISGELALLRYDPAVEQTSSGLLVPNEKLVGRFTNEAASAKERPVPDFTAVVIQIGDKVEGVKVGERYLMTGPALPVPVCDNTTDDPLGLIDHRDLRVLVLEDN